MKEKLINKDLKKMDEVRTCVDVYAENCCALRALTIDEMETVDDFIKELKTKRKN